jgi:hypothetical protein
MLKAVSLPNNTTEQVKKTNRANRFSRAKPSKIELDKLRKKIRNQLIVKSYVDNWPYVNSISAKARMHLLHRLRLVDQALSRLNRKKDLAQKNDK